jgi:PadR family transcriptional regulator, regulatory protein PadR
MDRKQFNMVDETSARARRLEDLDILHIVVQICRRSRYLFMKSPKADILQGTLDMLILKIVACGPIHGYAIAQRIRSISNDVLQVQQGSLYPALHRLEERNWLQAQWGEAESGREAKFYTLTKSGRKQLSVETLEWDRLSDAVRLIMQTSE